MTVECALFGTLGKDADARQSKNGNPYLRLNVAVSEGDTTRWISVMCFDPAAIENAGAFIKGARVYVEGRHSLNEWTANDGTKRIGESVLSSHCRLAAIGRNRPKSEKPKPAAPLQLEPTGAPGGDMNDEIPF